MHKVGSTPVGTGILSSLAKAFNANNEKKAIVANNYFFIIQ